MTFLTVDHDSAESVLAAFDKIAEKLSHDIQLKVNDAYYRIVDFEFYTYSENAIPDPHTYKHALQLQANKFYLHASGIDITFGDGKNHGGMLLRGIIRLHDGSDKSSGFMKEPIDGPHKVATELMSNLNALNSNGANDIRLIDIQGQNQDHQFFPGKTILKTKRIGLTPKPADPTDYFLQLPLRYIIIMQQFPNFKQPVKGIESIVKEKLKTGELDAAQAKDILGYTLK